MPLATLLHRSTSLGSSVGGGYVFLFLVFWSFGFRVGFHAPLLVARMGDVSLSLHVLRVSYPKKTNIVVTILFQRHFTRLRPFCNLTAEQPKYTVHRPNQNAMAMAEVRDAKREYFE